MVGDSVLGAALITTAGLDTADDQSIVMAIKFNYSCQVLTSGGQFLSICHDLDQNPSTLLNAHLYFSTGGGGGKCFGLVTL